MASGAKLPKTNLNLIRDTDMIDHADINAIAQAVELNAQAVEATTKPIKAELTSDKFSTGYLSIWRIGKLCLTTGFFRFTQEVPTAVYHTLGVVPVGFRPAARVTAWNLAQSSGGMAMLRIETDGVIDVYNYGTNPLAIESGLTANLTWITNG